MRVGPAIPRFLTLFEPDLPPGFRYRDDFISREEERDLADAIGRLAFDTFRMRGVVARRRVKFFGAAYDERPASPMPDFLLALRARLAAWADVDPSAFAMALINEYTQGATIGWHRDAPQYDITAGVSLLSACRMKLRPYVSPKAVAERPGQGPRRTTHEIVLAPRSGYLITGAARAEFEHSIPATPSLRYSITFRTLR
jgi:alkylated DNA repair dioxygenase AlkB